MAVTQSSSGPSAWQRTPGLTKCSSSFQFTRLRNYKPYLVVSLSVGNTLSCFVLTLNSHYKSSLLRISNKKLRYSKDTFYRKKTFPSNFNLRIIPDPTFAEIKITECSKEKFSTKCIQPKCLPPKCLPPKCLPPKCLRTKFFSPTSVTFVLGLPFTCPGGFHMFTLFNASAPSWNLLLFALLEGQLGPTIFHRLIVPRFRTCGSLLESCFRFKCLHPDDSVVTSSITQSLSTLKSVCALTCLTILCCH